jgi:hypothetical protein
MQGRKPQKLPAQLERLQEQFNHWRLTHPARSRIPDSLWGRAIKLAGTYGICRTARTLRLDYYALKKRFIQGSVTVADSSKQPPAATFLELPPPLVNGFGECTLEWEDTDGAKMRVHLQGGATPDLAALSRSFWSRGS